MKTRVRAAKSATAPALAESEAARERRLKKQMGYTKFPRKCSSCTNYMCDIAIVAGTLKMAIVNPRCLKGGFPVQTSGSCNSWKAKQ